MDDKALTVLVIGDNHKKSISEYYALKKVEPYLLFEYKKAKKYRKNAIKMYRAALSAYKGTENEKFLRDNLDDIEKMSDIDYYEEITLNYEHDEHGNVIRDENLKGEYISCNIAKDFACPFILKDGTTSFSALKKDIDWDKTNSDPAPYEIAWDTVMGNKTPSTDEEIKIYNNMKDHITYLSLFSNKREYVDFCTKFWTFSVANEDKWTNCDISTISWVQEYFDKFIKKLPDDTLLTIYEYFKKK